MTDRKQNEADCAEIGELADAHKLLAPFAGTFAAEVRLWMGPGDPIVSTGVMTNTLDLGGRFLRQHYEGDPGAGPSSEFQGRGYWGYNTVSNQYEGFWIDTASTVMQTDTGNVDAAGKVWTMIGQTTCPRTGKPMKKRSTITLEDRNHHRMEMYFAYPDGDESKAMEIRYTRT